MKREQKASREGIERWIDDRIRAALGSLTVPLEGRIRQMRKRVERLQSRLQGLVALTEQTLDSKKSTTDREKPNKS